MKKIVFLLCLLGFSKFAIADNSPLGDFNILPAMTQTNALGDLLDPFIMPPKKHLISETYYTYARMRLRQPDESGKRPVAREIILAEYITYGLAENWAIYGERQGNNWKKVSDGHLKTKSAHWIFGVYHNFINTPTDTLQGYANYYQWKEEGIKMDKGYALLLKYGHQFDWGKPYLLAEYTSTLNKGRDNVAELIFNAGIYHKLSDKVGAELGAGYYKETDIYKRSNYSFNGSIGYQLTDGIALRGKGTYTFHNHANSDTDDLNYNAKNGFSLEADLILGF